MHLLVEVVASQQFNVNDCAPARRGRIGGFHRAPDYRPKSWPPSAGYPPKR
jgi:hypothetical protein